MLLGLFILLQSKTVLYSNCNLFTVAKQHRHINVELAVTGANLFSMASNRPHPIQILS